LLISGIATRPIAAAVAALEPHSAANSAQATTLLIASPPRSLASHRWPASNRSRLAFDPPNTAPMKMNSGMASSAKLLIDW
jgi:hypothetical protein